MRKRLIKISKDRIFYTQKDFVALADTNFPKSAGFGVFEEIFWEVNLIKFDKKSKHLEVNITDYHPEDQLAFDKQTSQAEIKSIQFQCLDLDQLRPFLNRYVPQDFEPFSKENAVAIEVESPGEHPGKMEKTEKMPTEQAGKISSEPVHFQENFNYYYKDALFNLGFVEIQKKFDFIENPLSFKIYNSEILPEFNYIKSYFPKVFHGKKQFRVEVWIEMAGDQITRTQATSREISSINESLIDSIKRLRTLQIPSATIKQEVDKSLFTPDEIFSHNEDDGLDGNVFQQDGKDILDTFLHLKDIRNKKQLEYIAGYKHSPSEKIRFTLNPIFGFLFFIEGETMNHYCWELLNSHATYLWSFEKTDQPEKQLRRIESSINIIRDMGRKEYKNAYRQNLLDTDVNFSVINHRHASSPLKESFVYWKQRFKECLV